MTTELEVYNVSSDLDTYLKDSIDKPHLAMIERVKGNLPEIHRGQSQFMKTQSQFMDNMLTVSHPTPLRNLRQILAEMTRTESALKENYYKIEKKKVTIKKLKRKLEATDDDLDKEMLELQIAEKLSQIDSAKGYVQGAIRKLTNYSDQYNNIMNKLKEDRGVETWDEIDFEEEEERYHIGKAFSQALCAARSRGGMIDEGNFIYFQQIGINGTTAQHYLTLFLKDEHELIQKGVEVPHDVELKFLDQMMERFKGCSKRLADHKGMTVSSETALLKAPTKDTKNV